MLQKKNVYHSKTVKLHDFLPKHLNMIILLKHKTYCMEPFKTNKLCSKKTKKYIYISSPKLSICFSSSIAKQ